MNALKEAKKGDVILLDYLPDSGVNLTVNAQPQGKPIPGEDFQRALLRIWLGDKPSNPDLKKGMLGGRPPALREGESSRAPPPKPPDALPNR